MLQRLGNVLFWVSVIVTVAWLARGAWRAASFVYAYQVWPTVSADDLVIILGVPGVVVGAGWAICYILGGLKKAP